ncbi:MAG: tyrosine-type recombinase/integrase, partial [Gammaproteobacteria bacterium]
MAGILYGPGLRLLECVRLRVKDVDFGYSQITVRNGKGDKDRVTLLPAVLHATFRTHLEGVQALHQKDHLKSEQSGSGLSFCIEVT